MRITNRENERELNLWLDGNSHLNRSNLLEQTISDVTGHEVAALVFPVIQTESEIDFRNVVFIFVHYANYIDKGIAHKT